MEITNTDMFTMPGYQSEDLEPTTSITSTDLDCHWVPMKDNPCYCKTSCGVTENVAHNGVGYCKNCGHRIRFAYSGEKFDGRKAISILENKIKSLMSYKERLQAEDKSAVDEKMASYSDAIKIIQSCTTWRDYDER